jgi:polyisoprenoid-binding protein YceI
VIKKVLVGVVIVVLLGAGAFYWFVIRDTPEKQLTLTKPTGTTSGQADDPPPASLDGTWKVRSADPTRAGLRIKEKFLGGVAQHTAVGRTSEVTGSLTLAGTKVTAGTFTVDLASLEYTDDPPGLDVASRAHAMQTAGLQTDQFPTTSFELTQPIDLGSAPKAGQTITTDATGELTLHGVTKTITFSVDAQLIDGQIEIATSDPVPVQLADYGITPPAQGPVAEVSSTGSFEFLVRLEQS